MPNVENILKVADAIEKHEIPGLGFNMDYLIATSKTAVDGDKLGVKDCGTVACIAGWANAITKTMDDPRFDRAAAFLGLDTEASNNLFYAYNHPEAFDDGWGDITAPLDEISAEQAVRTLRHLAATGKVDWTV